MRVERELLDIEQYHDLLAPKAGRWCSSFDFQKMIEYRWAKSLLYIDPPYYQMGNGLYHCGMTEWDHRRLANSLRTSPHLWLLSYDDCPEIRKLYDWAVVEKIDATYGMSKEKKQTELLIYSRGD